MTTETQASAAGEIEGDVEDLRTQRRRLAGVWLAAGSALAAMVGVSWYVVVAYGGHAPGGDWTGHAATAEWLRTMPWWDWRGWSDWFYGGQAIGVSYPPLGHAWMRFTHPVYGQMAAVTLGLLVLLPWGTLRLARAVGCTPSGQRAAIAGVLVLTAASGQMHWVLSGFHATSTFYGSWPAMLAIVLGLHSAAWAARCRSPVTAGIVVGLAALLNATVVPGVAVVCAALLATSGASFSRAARWAATAGCASLAVCAWWLVPFVAGWARLVRWEAPLSDSWIYGDLWQAAVLATVGIAAAWAARRGPASSRRLAVAALAGLTATLLGDLVGYLRPERWMELPLLVAAMAASGLVADRTMTAIRPARPAWVVLGAAFLIVFAVITLRLEAIPLALWLLWRPHRAWVWGGALAWAAVLLLVPLWGQISHPTPPEPRPVTPLEAAAQQAEPGISGLVFSDRLYHTASGDVRECEWVDPWRTTADTRGTIRPLFGLYRETSSSAEFQDFEIQMRGGSYEPGGPRPHWFDAWTAAGSPSIDASAAAHALGARWLATCDAEGNASVTELPVVRAEGVTVAPHAAEDAWHEAAVEWWISLTSESAASERNGSHPVPVLASGDVGRTSLPYDQAASGVSLRVGRDSLTVEAQTPGWVWLRVPWDPDWRSTDDSPVLKGAPGHLIVWAKQGVTELRWAVPGTVDAAAAAVTGVAVLAATALAAVNRRRGFQTDSDRSRPAADALEKFADTVDGWIRTAAQRARRVGSGQHPSRHTDN